MAATTASAEADSSAPLQSTHTVAQVLHCADVLVSAGEHADGWDLLEFMYTEVQQPNRLQPPLCMAFSASSVMPTRLCQP